MTNKQEYLLCAAIWYKDGYSYPFFPLNIFNGYVICGFRHSDCITLHTLLTNRTTKSADIQGFLTSKNRFVNRAEAADIAYKAGQINNIAECLFSEDIY